MSALVDALIDEFDDRALALLADRLAPLLADRLGRDQAASPWLKAEEAADYLSCSRRRLYDLVMLGKLEPRRDGRRLLFRRDELDAYLENHEGLAK